MTTTNMTTYFAKYWLVLAGLLLCCFLPGYPSTLVLLSGVLLESVRRYLDVMKLDPARRMDARHDALAAELAELRVRVARIGNKVGA